MAILVRAYQIVLKDPEKCIGMFKDNLISTYEEVSIPKYLN